MWWSAHGGSILQSPLEMQLHGRGFTYLILSDHMTVTWVIVYLTDSHMIAGSHMTRACSAWREGVWDMTSSLWPAPWSAYRSQHSIWSLANWSLWLIKGLLWMVSKLEAWEVNWVRSVLCHKLEHSRNQSMSAARSLWR